MTRLKLLILYLIFLSIILGCEDKKDEHYKRPEWLAGPIYQQLEEEGRFTLFMSLLEQMGYDEILGKTGYFTLFAPNDSAIQVFLKEKNLNSVDELDTTLVRDIVQYALVENGYTPYTLAAYQSSSGWVEGLAFRRLTRSSKKIYKSTAIDEDGNLVDAYIKNEGVKYIPYFLEEFFTTTGVSSENYNKYFPSTEYTGFNVVDAKVLGDYIIAENGYIYEVDKVILPLPNLDEYLNEHPDKDNYTDFKNLLSKVAEYELDTSEHNTNLPVYFKTYGSYNYSVYPDPNIEEYLTSDNDYQTFCYSMFVPDNNSMQEFYNNKFLKYYATIDDLADDRIGVVTDFINSHLSSNTLWYTELPSYESSFRVLLGDNNINTSKMASNGIFYGISDVLQKGNYFNSVYSEICLNPDHKNFYMAIKIIGALNSLKNLLTSKEIDYTLFLTEDDIFADEGYYYTEVLGKFYPESDGDEKVTEMVNLMVVRGDYSDLSGKGFLKTLGGSIIRYDNNVVWGGGNIEDNAQCSITETIIEPNNGTVYKLSKNVLPPAKTYIEILTSPPSGANYTQFNLYLTNSGLVSNGVITGVQNNKGLTILVPTDDAMNAAGLPAYNTTDSLEQVEIKNFLLYHILQEIRLPETGTYKTYNVLETIGKFNVYREVSTTKSSDGFEITDGTGSKAVVLNSAGSCNFSVEGACIYQIDKALKYE